MSPAAEQVVAELATPHQRRVALKLQRLLADPRVCPGGMLPAERELETRLKVSRRTVRTVLQEMRRHGLLSEPMGRGRGATTQVVADEGDGGNAARALQRTVVMVSTFSGQIPEYQRQQGWEIYTMAGAVDRFREAAWHTLFVHPSHLDQAEMTRLLREAPRGLLVTHYVMPQAACEALLSQARRRSIPVVVYDYDPAFAGYDTVASDHESGSYELTRFLIRRGCRRILQLNAGFPGDGKAPWWFHARNAGYLRAMLEAGLTPQTPVQPSKEGLYPADRLAFEHDVRLAAECLAAPLAAAEAPDALLVLSDGMLTYVSAACRQLGRVPGRDLLLAGYDNYWQDVPGREWEPVVPAATVDKRNPVIGRELAELLIARIADTLPPEPQHRLVPPELIIPETAS